MLNYDKTPVFDREQATPDVFVHIGGGKFAARCGTCDVIETGEVGHLNSWKQRHAWDAHRVSFGPMLPR